MSSDATISFAADDINQNGSIFCHMLPLTEDTGSADTCCLLGEFPDYINQSTNIMNDADDTECFHWGGAMKMFYDKKGFGDISKEIRRYNPMVTPGHEQKPSTGVALMATHYRWAKGTKSYSNKKMGTDTFSELAGANSLQWRCNGKGFWGDAPASVQSFV